MRPALLLINSRPVVGEQSIRLLFSLNFDLLEQSKP